MDTALILHLTNKGRSISGLPIRGRPPLVTSNGGGGSVYPPHSALIRFSLPSATLTTPIMFSYIRSEDHVPTNRGR